MLRPVTRRELIALAAPAAASAVLNNAFRVIDQYSVQWLGTDAQAAVGSCTFVLIAFYALYSVVSAGTAPLIARATGGLDEAWRRRIFGSALVGATAIAVAVLVGCGLFAGQIVALLGLSGQPAALAATYLRTLAIVGLPLALAPVMDATFIAMGHTALPMALQVLATIGNGVLNWLLIYRLGYGIAGAALATGISRAVAVGIGLWVLWRWIRPQAGDLRVGPTLREVVRIGSPMGLNTLAYAAVYWALLAVAISPLGPTVNAALGIGFSALEGFTWPVFHGVSLAVASLVGRRLGAGQPDQAVATVRLALPLSTGLGLAAALVFWLLAVPLCGAFTEDPAVLAEAVLYARVLAFSQVFVALEGLAEGVLEGAGDTKTVLWWSAPINALRIPLGWAMALPLGLGPAGVWWAINLTTFAKAAGKGVAVVRGRWLQTELRRT